MSRPAIFLRRARLRSLKEGQVQTARAESLDDDVRDNAERWQDYGFAANPVDGQGLKIEIGGHALILRWDRIAERPQLDPYEVALWHHEGHTVRLKAGKLVQVDCDQFVLNAAVKAILTAPDVEINASSTATITTATLTASASTGATVDTPTLTATHAVSAGAGISAATTVSAPTVAAATSLTVGSVELNDHGHGNVTHGPDISGPPTPR